MIIDLASLGVSPKQVEISFARDEIDIDGEPRSLLAPTTPTSHSLLTTTSTTTGLEPGSSSAVKSTNFTGSIPSSRAEIRHKSEIEIEVSGIDEQAAMDGLVALISDKFGEGQ